MNGGQALIRTLVASGVDVCFMNPGTSEMHFVAALDQVPEMRGVLALFEGVATGAADGYARMSGTPAATLLHLGPGLGNGLANLHNARRAKTPIVNIVGDHATTHKRFDAPLDSDIDAVASNVSSFIRRSLDASQVADDAVDTIRAAYGPPGQVATLILPADVSWTECAAPRPFGAIGPRASRVSPDVVGSIAKTLRDSQRTGILLGGTACRERAVIAAGRIAAATGSRLFHETLPTRLQRGAGLPAPERIAYLGEMAAAQLADLEHLVLVDAPTPVSFFGYPGKPSYLPPAGCEIHTLAEPSEDAADALEALAEALDAANTEPLRQGSARPERPTGDLTVETFAAAVAALLPEGAIVSDESNTSGLFSMDKTAGAAPHDWLCLTGGAIGQGLPVALGAAVAAPDRRVVALQADGSALYTLQAWWSMARQNLDVTTILLNNASYAILNMELLRVGADASGPRARQMLDLSGPTPDFVSLAKGMGLSASRASTADELVEQFERSLATPGPSVIEAIIPSLF